MCEKLLYARKPLDRVQLNIPPFSMHDLILVEHKVLSQFYQPLIHLSSLLNRHDTIQYLNCVMGQIFKYISYLVVKIDLQLCGYQFFWFLH